MCQHCVHDFDHHCGVLGVCVAGKGVLAGNMRFFMPLLACGQLAICCSITAGIVTLYTYAGHRTLAILLGLLCFYTCCQCCALAMIKRDALRRGAQLPVANRGGS